MLLVVLEGKLNGTELDLGLVCVVVLEVVDGKAVAVATKVDDGMEAIMGA